MNHIHYDLAEVERQFRAMREAAMPAALAAQGDKNHDMLHEQDKMFEANLAVVLAAVRMKNEGRCDEFIAHVLGVFVSNIFCHAASISETPQETIVTMFRLVSNGLTAAYGGDDLIPGTTFVTSSISGQRGGRA
ncbi:hypothetical protein [Paracoccus denitrificans]|uniref:hypothetical protein n=1 Tax=Paracoccus denitrificans TaxID=266 RepID=UPI003364D38B